MFEEFEKYMFDSLYRELIENLENCRNVEEKVDLIDEFCQIFPNFDSNRLEE